MISDLTGQPGEAPSMRCDILMTTGAEAAVEIAVTDASGTRRVPTVEEFMQIVYSLAKHHFTLTLEE